MGTGKVDKAFTPGGKYYTSGWMAECVDGNLDNSCTGWWNDTLYGYPFHAENAPGVPVMRLKTWKNSAPLRALTYEERTDLQSKARSCWTLDDHHHQIRYCNRTIELVNKKAT